MSIDSLIKKIALEEKLDQMLQINSFGYFSEHHGTDNRYR